MLALAGPFGCARRLPISTSIIIPVASGHYHHDNSKMITFKKHLLRRFFSLASPRLVRGLHPPQIRLR